MWEVGDNCEPGRPNFRYLPVMQRILLRCAFDHVSTQVGKLNELVSYRVGFGSRAGTPVWLYFEYSPT